MPNLYYACFERMGQIVGIFDRRREPESFPDLENLPPEIAVEVLSHLKATDLCLAACVWQFANDNALWERLCYETWGYVSIYKTVKSKIRFNYKELYLLLDESTLIFNVDPHEGIKYMVDNGVLDDNPLSIAKFINSTKTLRVEQVGGFLRAREDVLDQILLLQEFKSKFLPDALRQLFSVVHPCQDRGVYLDSLLSKFASRFLRCNPDCVMPHETITILCYSLIMLSVDLSSPHVKNKMSKREYIKNLRGTGQVSEEYIGDMYDNIYLLGHIAVQPNKKNGKREKIVFPFERPYGKIFF